MFLTRGALSKECANLPNTCNVCSSRMSPIPHPHTPGNMWLARCDYVSKLINPRQFAHAMQQVVGGGENACRGTGRYAAEHWIHSHPAARPCDLHTDPAYVWGYWPIPQGDFLKELKPAPRFPLATYTTSWNDCGQDGQLVQQRLDEYQGLFQMAPTDAWWGWDFFNTSPRLSLGRMDTEMVNAKCYASRYPDLARAFCGGCLTDSQRTENCSDPLFPRDLDHCNILGLLHHFHEYGKAEKRHFRCKDVRN